tara:strand:+ start:571 stop:783 length:213 start_codon:yes stop_codon:yes gene_type:complete
MPWCVSCDKYLSPNSVSVVGTCSSCGNRVIEGDDKEVKSQKIPWHFWVFVTAAMIYLGWRLIEGLWVLFT